MKLKIKRKKKHKKKKQYKYHCCDFGYTDLLLMIPCKYHYYHRHQKLEK